MSVLDLNIRVTRQFVAAAVSMVVVGSSAVAPSFAAEGEQTIDDIRPMSDTTFYTFPGNPRIAVSQSGNVVRYEGPVGYDHIGVGQIGEGYVLCYGSSVAYDTGTLQAGFSPPSSASCSGNQCTMTRSTLDGRLRLQQNITKDPAGRSLTIRMTLRNLSSSPVSGIILRRQVDFDVDTGGLSGSGDFVNWWGASEQESVFAWNATNDNPRFDHQMILRNFDLPTPISIRTVAKVTSGILDATCSPANIAANGPVQGDFGGTVQYAIGSLGVGRNAVVSVQYSRN